MLRSTLAQDKRHMEISQMTTPKKAQNSLSAERKKRQKKELVWQNDAEQKKGLG